ncbi:hypothetical protein ACFV06_41205, partial [Streptomyces sp. NPDC059618]|uniref:hypothetical protein n=1 Tax=Streptomyces sp. NPDC059618 TaxID=3346887 RepID=UPI003695A5A9
VKVRPLGDTSAKQIIVAPGDVIHWQWSIFASEPGQYDLALTITTFEGKSARALATLSPPIMVHLSVGTTISHQVNSVQSGIIAWSGVVVALAAIFAFRGPLVNLIRARKEAREAEVKAREVEQEEERYRDRDGYR